MAKSCSHRKISFAYPKHWPRPEDLLHFIESTEFAAEWARLGLDDEDDMVSLQLCVMSHPDGDEEIEGSGGLRVHQHCFQRTGATKSVTVFYGYWPDFGVVYLNCVEAGLREIKFSASDLNAIRQSLMIVERELERVKTVRVRNLPAKAKDGGPENV